MLHSTTCTLIYCHFQCMTRMYQMYSSEATIEYSIAGDLKKTWLYHTPARGFTGMIMISYQILKVMYDATGIPTRTISLAGHIAYLVRRMLAFPNFLAGLLVYWRNGRNSTASQPLHSQERRQACSST
jgi:hypothetical protein